MIKDEQLRTGYVSIITKDGSLANVATIEQTGWIPTDAGLPGSYIEVFVYPPPNDYCNTAMYGKVEGSDCWYYVQNTEWGIERHVLREVTHWQPLIKPPTIQFVKDL